MPKMAPDYIHAAAQHLLVDAIKTAAGTPYNHGAVLYPLTRGGYAGFKHQVEVQSHLAVP